MRMFWPFYQWKQPNWIMPQVTSKLQISGLVSGLACISQIPVQAEDMAAIVTLTDMFVYVLMSQFNFNTHNMWHTFLSPGFSHATHVPVAGFARTDLTLIMSFQLMFFFSIKSCFSCVTEVNIISK